MSGLHLVEQPIPSPASSGLQVFNNPEFGQIRAVEINGEAWLVGKDVAEALGYANPPKAVRDHVDPEDKTVNESFTVNGTCPTLINQSGLYSLVLSSKLPGAKRLKRWVTSEVLPSIQKHGAYMTPDTIERVLTDPDTIINLATQLKAEREHRLALEEQAKANAPKVLFADSVSASKDSILVGELAKLLKQNGVNIGQNRLFHWLRQHGYLIKRQGKDYNLPTQKSMELGLFEIKETAITHSDGYISTKASPRITGKGQRYFISLFLSKIAEAEGDAV